MYQDIWTQVIQYVAPIDVYASLLLVNSNIYELIGKCCVSFDDISKACESNWCSGLRIIVSASHKEDDVCLLGNSKYFIRLHLLQLAMQLGKEDPENGFDGGVSNILNYSQLQLLNFYRSMFFPYYEKPMQQERVETIKYVLLGDVKIGKSYFFAKETKTDINRVSLDFNPKIFLIPNEINCKQQLWNDRYHTKLGYLKDFGKYNIEPLICFSMYHRKTFDRVEDCFKIANQFFKTQGKSELGIILGLHPDSYSYRYQKAKVTMKEALQKAFEFEKSVFVHINSVNSIHVYTPFWFIQLQFTYFNSVPPPPALQEEYSLFENYCVLL